jgi:hypothetical protein
MENYVCQVGGKEIVFQVSKNLGDSFEEYPSPPHSAQIRFIPVPLQDEHGEDEVGKP